MKRLFILFVMLVVGVTLPSPLPAQVAAQFDTARMQRDLDIMNAILDRLVFNVPGQFIRIGGDATKGIYLPDYGVIFLMPRQSGALRVYSFTPEAERRRVEMMYQKSVETYKKATPSAKAGRRSSAYVYQTESEQNIKEPLLEFFAKYADAIGQLDDSERIAIYTAGGDNTFFSFTEGEGVSARSEAEAGNKDLLAIARKADVVALRTGRLKPEDFNNRVVFRDIDSEAASSEIDIMARIIDTALQGRSRGPRFRGGDARGIYLENYGVIFFTNAVFGQNLAFQILENVGKHETPESLEHRLLELQTASNQQRESWSAAYKKFKQQLGEVIADYGHTLRQLKPQDNIVITADLENAPDEGPRFLVCRVKKQHVDAFNARRLPREQLLKLIAFTEY